MIFYDSGDSPFLVIWRWRGSVIPQAAAWAFTSAALEAVMRHSGLLDEYLYKYIDVTRDGTSLSYVWWGFTTVLSVLIGVRCNTSYQRFWEGAQLVYLVRGEWFNCVSSLLSFCSEDPEMGHKVQHFQHVLVRIASLLHCMALQHVCDVAEDSLEILDMEGFDDESLEYLETVHDRCDVLVQWLQRLIMQSSRKGVLDAAPPILTRSFQELSRGIVNLNNVRRIKDIPFPYPYHQTTVIIMMLHWFLTPFVAVMYINSAVLASLLILIGQTGLWAIIFISSEMDQPFGEDPNDLPMAEMQRDFNRSLLSLLDPRSQRVPGYQAVVENEEDEDALAASRLRRNSASKGKHQTLKFDQVNIPLSPHASVVSLNPDLLGLDRLREVEDVEGHDAAEKKGGSKELESDHGADNRGVQSSEEAMSRALELIDYTLSPISTHDEIDVVRVPRSKLTGPNLAPVAPTRFTVVAGPSENATTAHIDEDTELADLESLPQKLIDLGRQTSGQSCVSYLSHPSSGDHSLSGNSADIKFTVNPLRHKARRLRDAEQEDPSSLTARQVKVAGMPAKPRRMSLSARMRNLSAA